MKPLIVSNWKMNPSSLNEAKRLFNLVRNGAKRIKNVEVVICPPFVYLGAPAFAKRFGGLRLGSQNCFWEEKGAFTGEISPLILKNLGCKYVIVGHSERRNHFGETDEIISKKIKSALKVKLSPIFCIGESWKAREEGNTQEVLKSQIEKGLRGVKKNDIKNLVLAYEPVWAIGTGKACSSSEAQTMGLYSKKIIAKLFSPRLAKKIPILYGGSVNSKNARDYLIGIGIDGLLVGGASLNAKEFIGILKSLFRA